MVVRRENYPAECRGCSHWGIVYDVTGEGNVLCASCAAEYYDMTDEEFHNVVEEDEDDQQRESLNPKVGR